MVPISPPATSRTRRRLAWGGVAGPAAFITAWSVLGARKPGYSAIDDPISRLAAVDASTRVPMTAGFLAFGAGVFLYASAMRDELPGGTAQAAAATALATAAVAALPLGSALGDEPHAVAAGLAYAALAATPIAGARAFARRGDRAAAGASMVAGVATAALLTASIVTDSRTGLFQRAGLTLGDIWIASTAVWVLRTGRHRRPIG